MLYLTHDRPFLLLVAIGGMLAACAPALRAQTVISDRFSGTNAASLQGRTPDTIDLPGGTYTHTTFGGTASAQIDTGAGNAAPSARTGFNDTVYLNISSNGSYVKPTSLNLSIDLRINTIAIDAGTYRGIGLGFFTTTPANGVESATGFTGLTVVPNGTLYLVVNGARTTTSAPAPTGFSTGQFYTLSYSLNTSTGALSNVVYNGVDDSSSFTSATTSLTTTNTNLVGFYGSTGVSNAFYGYVDNFTVTMVPEPPTAGWPLAALILFGAGVRLHRARRTAL